MKKYLIFGLILVALFSSKPSSAAKPSDFGLKEGDLISAIFSDDPDVYIINEQGFKRLFLNPEIFKFYAHLGGFANVKLVTPEVRDSFPTSGFFRNCEDNDQKVYGTSVEGEDKGQLHWIDKSGDQAVQEDPDFFKKVFCINRKEFNWYPKGNEFKALKEVPKYHRTEEAENPVICHHPTDDPKTFQTIRVAPESLDAHFQHGDNKGACPTYSLPIPQPVPIYNEVPKPKPEPFPTPTAIYLIKPMVLKDILKVESVVPYDVANLGFGVYQVSAQYSLGSYHQGKWYEGNPDISGAVWIEFGWPNMPQVDIVIRDENDQQRKIYLPATGSNKNPDGSSAQWYYWISEDGSSYYGRKDHNFGWPDLSSVDALRPEHLAQKAGISTYIPTLTPTPTLISAGPPYIFAVNNTNAGRYPTVWYSDVIQLNVKSPQLLTPVKEFQEFTTPDGVTIPGTGPSGTTDGYGNWYSVGQMTSIGKWKKWVEVGGVKSNIVEYAVVNKDTNATPLPTPTPTPTPTSISNNTCSTFAVSQKYYFDICAKNGYDNVCLNKYTGAYQGCTKNTYNDCTLYNTNKDLNLLCAVSNVPIPTPTVTPTPTPTPTSSQAVNCYVKIDGIVVKSVYATDRNNCYSQTSFGSANCNYYTSYFTAGTRFLEQYFGATDRVNNEYCSCQGGVCVQGTTSSLLEPGRLSNFAVITRNLTVGSTGNDVKQLQALLVNEVGYSADLITGYFGRITRDAVKRLQEKYRIRPVSGYFGDITRKTLNALIFN